MLVSHKYEPLFVQDQHDQPDYLLPSLQQILVQNTRASEEEANIVFKVLV